MTNGLDAVAAYWRSVEEASNGQAGRKQRRAAELLRLRNVADQFRADHLPDLPAITINTADIGGRVSGKVDPLGSWGQGVSISLKTSRVDPYGPDWSDQAKDRSLLFGHPLLTNEQGEQIRRFEAELLVLQQLLRSWQHVVVERELIGFGTAASDLKSYSGNGSWFAAEANRIWRIAVAPLVRHSCRCATAARTTSSSAPASQRQTSKTKSSVFCAPAAAAGRLPPWP